MNCLKFLKLPLRQHNIQSHDLLSGFVRFVSGYIVRAALYHGFPKKVYDRLTDLKRGRYKMSFKTEETSMPQVAWVSMGKQVRDLLCVSVIYFTSETLLRMDRSFPRHGASPDVRTLQESSLGQSI